MKMISVSVIILTTLISVAIKIRHENSHIQYLDTVIRFIERIGNIAEFYNSNIKEILIDLNNNDLFSDISIIKNFLCFEKTGISIPEAWEKSINSPLCLLSEIEKNLLVLFGNDLCTCDKNKILSITENTVNQLNLLRNNAVEQKNKNLKVQCALLISGSLAFILICI